MPLTTEQKRRKKVSLELNKLPLKSLQDYANYNEKARSLSMPVRPAPAEFHEHVKVKFLRRDGMEHPVPLKFRNALIDFEKKVEHGKIYELPIIAVRQYQRLGMPRYKQVTKPNGESDTVFSHKEPRFAFQIVLDD